MDPHIFSSVFLLQPGAPKHCSNGKSSTFWPLCNSDYPLTYVGIPWRVQKNLEQEWISVVLVFQCPGMSFFRLFTSGLLGWLPSLFIPCRNCPSGWCQGGISDDSIRCDCRALMLLLLPESWKEVMPADMYFAFANLLNAKLPSSWLTSDTLVLSTCNIFIFKK